MSISLALGSETVLILFLTPGDDRHTEDKDQRAGSEEHRQDKKSRTPETAIGGKEERDRQQDEQHTQQDGPGRQVAVMEATHRHSHPREEEPEGEQPDDTGDDDA